jgi:large subunit ribosomal protein L13
MKTILPDQKALQRSWYLIDASGVILGKLATKAAVLLRGKHKAIYTPHIDTGDGVIIINAEKVVLTGNKLEDKNYFRYSRHLGNVKQKNAREMMVLKPEFILKKAIGGMIPRTKHANTILKRLKIYRGSEHEHEAQSPIPVSIS